MNIWLPFLQTGSGSDVFTSRLAAALTNEGHRVTTTGLARYWQYLPWGLKTLKAPADTDITIASASYGFAVRRPGNKLIAVEHHCVLDPTYRPYRSWFQAIYHQGLLRAFEKASLMAADAIVAVSRYTAGSLTRAMGCDGIDVIANGIETDFFCPSPEGKPPLSDRPVRLLFVGNLTRRKGADLLPDIMNRLGPGFELHYTSGLRTDGSASRSSNMKPLGRLDRRQLRDAYRRADLFLFPTRFEGFGYAVVEAMACGTPAVVTDCSSLPELVEDGVTGRLCPIDNTEAFANAVRDLAGNETGLRDMGQRARAVAVERWSLPRMARDYSELCERVLRNAPFEATGSS